MEIPLRPDGLQLGESRRFQRVIWIVQRILWLVCLIVIGLALAGATGRGGPLAAREAIASTATITLPRVARRGAVDAMTIRFTADAPDHRLGLSADFLSRFEVETVTPRPVAEIATDDGALFLFAAMEQPPHEIRLSLRARLAGVGHPVVTADGQPLRITTLTLP